jgi:hypothetical protein
MAQLLRLQQRPIRLKYSIKTSAFKCKHVAYLTSNILTNILAVLYETAKTAKLLIFNSFAGPFKTKLASPSMPSTLFSSSFRPAKLSRSMDEHSSITSPKLVTMMLVRRHSSSARCACTQSWSYSPNQYSSSAHKTILASPKVKPSVKHRETGQRRLSWADEIRMATYRLRISRSRGHRCKHHHHHHHQEVRPGHHQLGPEHQSQR